MLLEFEHVTGTSSKFHLQDVSFSLPAGYIMGLAEILGSLYEKWDNEIFKEALKKMELPGTRVYGKMSRGERMKFQMAFAMAHRPALFLLDEVTAGMDPVVRIDFFKILQEVISTEEASVLMTSHIQEEIGQKMDYVGILENGRLVSFGESLDIIS